MNTQSALRAADALGQLAPAAAQHPVFKMLRRYWWFSVPTGFALYGILRQRYEKGGKFHDYIVDSAKILGPVLSIVTLTELASKLDKQGKLDQTQVLQQAQAPAQVPTAQQYQPAPLKDMS